MLRVFFAIIGLVFMLVVITLTKPGLPQQQSLTEAIYNPAPERGNFLGAGNVNVGNYEFGKDVIAGKDEADPPPTK